MIAMHQIIVLAAPNVNATIETRISKSGKSWRGFAQPRTGQIPKRIVNAATGGRSMANAQKSPAIFSGNHVVGRWLGRWDGSYGWSAYGYIGGYIYG